MGKGNILTMNSPQVKTMDTVRAETCFAEINGILKKYNCRLVPEIIINAEGGVGGGVKIIPNRKITEN